MAGGQGKPNLKWCPGCRLPYNVDVAPEGCPRCAKNPQLAERVQRERAREESGLGVLRGPNAALGWIVAGLVIASVVTSLVLWDVTSSPTTARTDSTAERFTMVVSALSMLVYAALSVATFLGANLFAWIAVAVVAIDLLVNGGIAVTHHSQAVFYALSPKVLFGAILLRQLLKSI